MPRSKRFDRQQVLERIMRLFQSKGYHQTSLSDILSAAGLSRQSLYDTYGDKNTLFLEALNLSGQRLTAHFDGWLREVAGGYTGSAAVLRQLLHSYGHDAMEHGCFLVGTMLEFRDRDFSVCAVLDEVEEHLRAVVKKIVLYGQGRDELSPQLSSDEMVALLLNARAGILVASAYKAPPDALDRMADITMRQIRYTHR